MVTVKLLNSFYSIQIFAINQYQKQRDHYETFLLKRKLQKIELQLRDMLEHELNEDNQSVDDSHLQMVQNYMSKQTSNSSGPPPQLDLPLFRRERKSEARLEKLKKKKNALKKVLKGQEKEEEEEPREIAEVVEVESDAITVVSAKNYFDKHTLNFVNTYGDSGGYSRIRQALGIQSKRECNLWGI
ncbi:hypothetical protein CJU89_4134 [Yarrowia sp. B02]|nr:hypothetical protein CJU89_4134 [Yarrowia sp. B02]